MRIQHVYLIVVLSLALSGCEKNAGPTYRPYAEMYKEQSDTTLRNVLSLGQRLKRPEPVVMLTIDSPWYFTAGDSTEGFLYESVKSGKEAVQLPHRVLIPNTPLWYETRFKTSLFRSVANQSRRWCTVIY